MQRLQSHAGGNPLYSRALLDELPADAWHRQDNLPAAALVRRDRQAPRGRLLAGRGPRCSKASRSSARTARSRPPPQLADVDAPLDALEEAAPAGLLRSDDTRGVPAPAFAHPLIAAAVYDQIGPARRARLHARAAELAEDEATRCAISPPRPRARTPSSPPGSRRSPSARRPGTRCSRPRWRWSPRRA